MTKQTTGYDEINNQGMTKQTTGYNETNNGHDETNNGHDETAEHDGPPIISVHPSCPT